MHSKASEETLMAAYAAGDDRALEALFNLLAPRLLAFLRRCSPDPRLAEELLQTTFVQLRHARHAYRPGTPVRPWLFNIAANVHGAARGYHLRQGDYYSPQSDVPETAMPCGGASERDRAVRKVIDGLQSSQRLVIHLHRFEGMRFQEIAQVIGASEDEIREQAIGVYQLLHERLEPLVGEGDEL